MKTLLVTKLTVRTASQDQIRVLGSNVFTELYFDRGVKEIEKTEFLTVLKSENPTYREKMFFARKVEINIDNHFNEEEVKWAKLMLED